MRSSLAGVAVVSDTAIPAELPSAVLFACQMNAVRSPMAEAILKHLAGKRVYVDSVGVRAGETDPFAVAVMDEIGIDLTRHRPKDFANLQDTSVEVVISLAPEAHHQALELTRTMAIDAEYWPTIDPTAAMGSREQILDAYRAVRDGLFQRIKRRFAIPGPPVA
jgi:protein-tyrosine-phosphatase